MDRVICLQNMMFSCILQSLCFSDDLYHKGIFVVTLHKMALQPRIRSVTNSTSIAECPDGFNCFSHSLSHSLAGLSYVALDDILQILKALETFI